MEGGHAGSQASSSVITAGVARPVPSKGVLTLRRGDVVRLQLNGAGGYGDPTTRPPEALADDIADGFVSHEAAAQVYRRR